MSVKLIRNILACVILAFLAKLPMPGQGVDYLESWTPEQHVFDLYYGTFDVSVGISGRCVSGATCGAACGVEGIGCLFPVGVEEDATVVGLDTVGAVCFGDSLFALGWTYTYWYSVCGPFDFKATYGFGYC